MDCNGLDITVKSGFTLTLVPFINTNTIYTDDYIANLLADNITVESTASINSDGLGYSGGDGSNSTADHINDGYGPGGEQYGFDGSDASGGSYGGFGKGGYGNTINRMTDIYGIPESPIFLGSGGGMRSSYGPGGDGGGGFKLDISGTISNSGTISADGEGSVGSISGGGSGGTVWIETNSLTGSGVISADGGNGGIYDGDDYGGGGGGGRIHVEYSTSTFSGTYSADGGVATGASSYGENGTVVIENHTNNHLFIQNTQGWVPEDSTSFETWFPNITDVTVCSATSAEPECLVGSDIVWKLEGGNRETTNQGYGWVIDITNMTVDANSSLSGEGLGYKAVLGGVGWGPSPGGYANTGTAYGIGGGGHGGSGADGETTGTYSEGGEQVGIPYQPIDLGSPGGSNNSREGANGGGSVKVTASGTVTIDGELNMKGGDDDYREGGGAGGSIWIDTNTLSGSGIIQSDGGNGGQNSADNNGGGGGGGRIYITYNSSSFSGVYSLIGGDGYDDARNGENGTVTVQNDTSNHLYIQNSQRWVPEDNDSFETLTAKNSVYLIEVHDNESSDHYIWGYLGENSFSSPSNQFEIFHDIEKTTRGWKGDLDYFVETTSANWTYDITNLATGWDIEVTNFSVDTGSSISLLGLGYAAGTATSIDGYGPGGGKSLSNSGNNGGTGGSYGGKGGVGSGGTEKEMFETPVEPMLAGSGGGVRDAYGPGGSGGEAIKIKTTNNLTLSGDLSANGEKAPGTISGGGSGGSIWLDVGNVLSGGGNISAIGGDAGSDSSDRSGAGGGGRIYIEYSSSTHTGTISSVGGADPISRAGEDGSLIIIDNTANDLILNQSQRWIPETGTSFSDWFSGIDDVDITTNSTLTLDTLNKLTTDDGIPWNISLTTLDINIGSKIDLDYLGYSGGTGTGIFTVTVQEEEEELQLQQMEEQEVVTVE